MDSDAGLFHKNEKERCFAYSAHTVCDPYGYVVEAQVTSGNVHDSVQMDKLVEKVMEKHGKPDFIAADAGYKTPYNCKYLLERKIKPAMPYTRPKGTGKGMFLPTEFKYSSEENCYYCPENEKLEYKRIDTEGYQLYKSNPEICRSCASLKKCTRSKVYEKTAIRHIWKPYIEETDRIRLTPDGKMIYKARKETIERVFADCKEKHGMRYTHLRGLGKVKEEILLTFACLNLKKMINALIKNGKLRLSFFS